MGGAPTISYDVAFSLMKLCPSSAIATDARLTAVAAARSGRLSCHGTLLARYTAEA